MCQYTPDNKRTKNTNQTKMCAIMVFYVYFVLYIELLFGNVGLNGSFNNDINALNPSSSIKAYIKCYPSASGMGWYRFSKIIFENSSLASGALCHCIEILIMQMYNFAPGCFHKINIYMKITDSAKITAIGQNAAVLKKVRAVRKDNIIFLDIYSSQINNDTYVLLNIPFGARITSAKCIEPYLVPETSDGEVIVCSVDLADNI